MPSKARRVSLRAPAVDDNACDIIAVWVRRQLGIVFSAEQKQQFADRLRTYLNSKNLTSAQVIAGLQRGDRLITRQVAEVVSTNYTFFLRETEVLDYMRVQILPRFPAEQVRIWSAAASSGEEAFSIAMYCYEVFGQAAARRVKILGTDISQRQIEHAEAGIYQNEQLSLVDAERKARWFEPGPDARHVRVAPALRELCVFRRLNLTQFPWPFEHRFHLVVLRNVLYYFEHSLRLRVLEACHQVAAPGAWLLTSLTEPMLDLNIRDRWRRVSPAIYQRVGT